MTTKEQFYAPPKHMYLSTFILICIIIILIAFGFAWQFVSKPVSVEQVQQVTVEPLSALKDQYGVHKFYPLEHTLIGYNERGGYVVTLTEDGKGGYDVKDETK